MGRFARELRRSVAPAPARALLEGTESRHALEGPRWRRTSRGFYVPASEVAATAAQRIVEAATILPSGAVIGGWAAAFAHGADLLDGLDDHTVTPLPVPVYLPPGLHRHDTVALHYRQADSEVEAVPVAGISVTTPMRTAVDLARWAPDTTEAVVALDCMLSVKLVSLDASGLPSAACVECAEWCRPVGRWNSRAAEFGVRGSRDSGWPTCSTSASRCHW